MRRRCFGLCRYVGLGIGVGGIGGDAAYEPCEGERDHWEMNLIGQPILDLCFLHSQETKHQREVR